MKVVSDSQASPPLAPSPIKWLTDPLTRDPTSGRFSGPWLGRTVNLWSDNAELHQIPALFKQLELCDHRIVYPPGSSSRVPHMIARRTLEGEKRLYVSCLPGKIGQGAYGRVHSMLRIDDTGRVRARAVKIPQSQPAHPMAAMAVKRRAEKYLIDETDVLRSIHRDGPVAGVMPPAEVVEEGGQVFAVFKAYDGDLYTICKALSTAERVEAFKQVVTGLSGLHSKGFVLSDPGLRNILIKRRHDKPHKPHLRVDIADLAGTLFEQEIRNNPQRLIELELGPFNVDFLTLNDHKKLIRLHTQLKHAHQKKNAAVVTETLDRMFKVRRERDVFAMGASAVYMFTRRLPQKEPGVPDLGNPQLQSTGLFFDATKMIRDGVPQPLIKLISDMCKCEGSQRPSSREVLERLNQIEFPS